MPRHDYILIAFMLAKNFIQCHKSLLEYDTRGRKWHKVNKLSILEFIFHKWFISFEPLMKRQKFIFQVSKIVVVSSNHEFFFSSPACPVWMWMCVWDGAMNCHWKKFGSSFWWWIFIFVEWFTWKYSWEFSMDYYSYSCDWWIDLPDRRRRRRLA